MENTPRNHSLRSDSAGTPKSSDLETRLADGALWLTLNRPETFNALTGDMITGTSSTSGRSVPATTYAWSCSPGRATRSAPAPT